MDVQVEVEALKCDVQNVRAAFPQKYQFLENWNLEKFKYCGKADDSSQHYSEDEARSSVDEVNDVARRSEQKRSTKKATRGLDQAERGTSYQHENKIHQDTGHHVNTMLAPNSKVQGVSFDSESDSNVDNSEKDAAKNDISSLDGNNGLVLRTVSKENPKRNVHPSPIALDSDDSSSLVAATYHDEAEEQGSGSAVESNEESNRTSHFTSIDSDSSDDDLAGVSDTNNESSSFARSMDHNGSKEGQDSLLALASPLENSSNQNTDDPSVDSDADEDLAVGEQEKSNKGFKRRRIEIESDEEGDEDPYGMRLEEELCNFSEESSFERGSEEALDRRDIELEFGRIRRSKLSMALQGFRAKVGVLRGDHHGTEHGLSEWGLAPTIPDRLFANCNGKTFVKGRCYQYSETTEGSTIDAVVGIIRFLSDDEAQCVLIVKFSETFLGDFDTGHTSASHVQVYEEIPPLSLTNFGDQQHFAIPNLVYEPQTTVGPGTWQRFSYFISNPKPIRHGRRETIRSLELFAGCGGMSLGFKKAGFEAVKLVEKDAAAVETLMTNGQSEDSIYHGDVMDFLKWCKADVAIKEKLGRIDVLHASPPCQGFSGANRFGGKNDKANNELSLVFVDFVEMFMPAIACFENVMGMWRRRHIQYLHNIVGRLMRLGYNVRCCSLKAHEYGDPQKRERLFLFAAKQSIPLPRVPQRTYGEGRDYANYVTVKDVLSILSTCDTSSIPNMTGKSTSLQPGEHGVVRLDASGTAPTIRAKSIPPVHFSEDRCINVREAALLQSFPLRYKFCGTPTEQYQQVGNAVPIELATAVAHSLREALAFYYEESRLV